MRQVENEIDVNCLPFSFEVNKTASQLKLGCYVAGGNINEIAVTTEL